MPKSVIFVVPSAMISRLPGLMSRCTMPGPVRDVEGAGRLGDDVQHHVGVEPAVPLEDLRQRLAVHQLHDQVGAAAANERNSTTFAKIASASKSGSFGMWISSRLNYWKQ